MNDNRFCSECGNELVIIPVGAETVPIYYGDWQTGVLSSPFHPVTGKRQYVNQYICKKWKKSRWFFYSKHDNYFDTKNIFNA